jgi:hypothetical protein
LNQPLFRFEYYMFFDFKKMAPQVGLEPTTVRLTAECSTTELLRNNSMILCFEKGSQKILVGLNGLEPSTSRLSGVRSNQLSYRPLLERVMRIELTTSAWKAEVLPLNYTRMFKLLPYDLS